MIEAINIETKEQFNQMAREMRGLNKSKIKTVLKKNEYKCVVCKGIFLKARTDEEAMKESKELYGEHPKEELCIVCDNCFKKIEKHRK